LDKSSKGQTSHNQLLDKNMLCVILEKVAQRIKIFEKTHEDEVKLGISNLRNWF
jgi:hypothetical protein